MTGDVPAAALRLLQSLPVHTHEARLPERKLAPQQRPGFVKQSRARGVSPIFGKGGIARPVRIGGHIYPSVTLAARKRHRSLRVIYAMIRAGEAEYV